MKLLLFDIDGTILQTHGVGRKAVEGALSDLLGRPVLSEGTRFSGKTDPQILRDVLSSCGLTNEEVDEALPSAVARYEKLMCETLRPENVTLLPGVADLVKRLHDDPKVVLAVLTGNIAPMAHLKLQAVGLDEYFPFGAFGSDSEHRTDLPKIAVDRAERHTGHRFSGKNVVIIGDTEHDIRCGAHTGVLAVGVCTGNYSRADLEPHGADVLLDDLTDFDLFRRSILSAAA